MSKTTKSSWLKGAVLLSSTIAVSALLLSPQASNATIITTDGCAQSNACTLPELFGGSSIQVGDLLLTDWTLFSNNAVNLGNIEIGTGYPNPDAEFGVWARNFELYVAGVGSKSLSYDFKVTSLGTDIIGTSGNLGYRYVVGPTALITGSLAVGTTPGSNDLGGTTDVYSLSQDPGPNVIKIPDLSSIWIRHTLSVSSNWGDNWALAGYVWDEYTWTWIEGPAFRNTFFQAEAKPVPEPGTLGLLALGLAGLLGVGRKRGYC